jgi:hypothetical protein
MRPVVSLASALALLLALAAGAEAAGKGKKRKREAPSNTFVGTLLTVAKDGKKMTVIGLPGKKKKQEVPTREIKVDDRTKVLYLGIKDKAEQKLTAGYFVIVELDEANKDTATTIATAKAPPVGKKKKKKNTDG